jgi:hypothetical protein
MDQLHQSEAGERPGFKPGQKSLVANLEQGAERHFLGVVDQDVDSAESGHGLIDKRLQIRRILDVAGQCQRLAAALADRFCCGLNLAERPPGGHYRDASGRQGQRNTLAHALTGARDDCHFACQFAHPIPQSRNFFSESLRMALTLSPY